MLEDVRPPAAKGEGTRGRPMRGLRSEDVLLGPPGDVVSACRTRVNALRASEDRSSSVERYRSKVV